jgi:hypothetical protein
MAKTADYLISGVWKDSEKRITHVLLHTMTGENSWGFGQKTSELQAINLLKEGKIIKTVIWQYPDWEIRVRVTYVLRNGKEYLRSDPNASTKDNLDNLISMKAIV